MGFLDTLFSRNTEEKDTEKPNNITDNTKEVKPVMPTKPVESTPLNPHDKRVKIEEQMAELATEYSNLRTDLKQTLFTERDELVQDQSQTQAKIAELTDRQTKYSQQKEELLAQDDAELYEQLEDNQQQLNNQTELIEKYREQNNGVESELNANDSALTKVNTAIENNQQAENNLSEEIKNETDLKKMYELMENQKKAVAHLYEERENLIAQRNELMSHHDSLSAENQQLLSRIDQAGATASDFRTKISQIDSQIKNNTQIRTQNISQLEGQLTNVAKELENNNSHLTQVTKELKAMDVKIQETFQSDYLVRDVKFDESKTYAVLQSSNDQDGQLTADIKNFVDEATGNETLVLTNQTFDNLNIDGKVYDLYKDLQVSDHPSDKRVSIQDNPDWKTEKSADTTKIFDKNDNHLMTVHFEDSKIHSIDYFADDKLNKTNIYNQDGILSKTVFYNESQAIDQEIYYRSDGSSALTKQFENEQLTSVQLFDEEGLQTNVFSSELQLVKWWFENIAKSNSDLVLIGDPTDETFKNMTNDEDISFESLTYLGNVHSNIGRIRALLHSKPVIENILVTTQDDLQSIEDITDRDINVSVVNKTSYNTDSQDLPNALI